MEEVMARYRPRLESSFTSIVEIDDEARLWLVRACLARVRNDPEEEFLPSLISRAIGVRSEFPLDPEDDGPRHLRRMASDRAKLLSALEARVAALSEKAHGPGELMRVAGRITRSMGLDELEVRTLAFIAASQLYDEFAELGRVGSDYSTRRDWVATVAAAVDVSSQAMAEVLSPKGRLMACGLIRPSDGHGRGTPWVLPQAVQSLFAREPPDEDEILRRLFAIGQKPRFTLANFSHQPGLDVAVSLIASALVRGEKGIHVLLHGPPGTGKSELARAIADAVGARLCEVPTRDDEDEPMRSDERAASLRLLDAVGTSVDAGRFCALVDEADDLLPTRSRSIFTGLFDSTVSNKAFFNELLEQTRMPVLWTANDAASLDEAHLRRFSAILEVRSPPRAERARIAAEHAARHDIDAAALDLAVDEERLPIASLETIARSVALCSAAPLPEGVSRPRPVAVVRQLTRGYLRLVGGTTKGRPRPTRLAFDPSLLNASVDLDAVIPRLREHPQATILLAGPPGTGKSAWARLVADALGRPLHVKAPSDLMSKYVGETEQKLAAAFAAAEDEDAVLLLDEVDTFLFPRARAERSWEVSHTNEMLVRVESFQGILIATTNATDRIDDAIHRRFDLKVELSPLTAPQRVRMVGMLCEALGLPAPGDLEVARLQRLEGLCAGDVVAVERRLRFAPVDSPRGLVDALVSEVEHRGNHRSPIGFLA
jgi:SpoVK/Ycf46/Vps4 family AAA+-type ATPase